MGSKIYQTRPSLIYLDLEAGGSGPFGYIVSSRPAQATWDHVINTETNKHASLIEIYHKMVVTGAEDWKACIKCWPKNLILW